MLAVALIVAVAFVHGCSLVDPLDDISGGKPRGTDSGAGDASVSDSSTSGPPSGCSGEQEPNYPTPRHLPFESVRFCGTVTSDDFDDFTIDVPQGGSYVLGIVITEGSPTQIDIGKGDSTDNVYHQSVTIRDSDVAFATQIDVDIHSTASDRQLYTFDFQAIGP
jgi:hypothetical protein